MIAATNCDTSEIVVKDNSIGVETDVTDMTIAMRVYRHQTYIRKCFLQEQ